MINIQAELKSRFDSGLQIIYTLLVIKAPLQYNSSRSLAPSSREQIPESPKHLSSV